MTRWTKTGLWTQKNDKSSELSMVDQEQFINISDLLEEADVKHFDEDATIFDIIQTMLSSTTSVERINGDCGLFIVDLSVIINKFNEWKRLLPTVTPYYAVKSNPNPMILKVLSILGAGFDCASKSEIESVLDLDMCPPEKIIFANPAKFDAHLRFARSVDVDLMTFDNRYELLKIAHIHPDAQLVLRIKVDDSYSVCQFNKKFGASLKDVKPLFERAKQLDLKIVGVSFHVGSGCQNVTAFDTAIERAKQVFDIGKEYGYDMHLLDIGGGFPGIDDDEHISFEAFATQINTSIGEHFPSMGNDFRVIAEPGRYFCSASHTLVLNVVAKNDGLDEDGNKMFMYTVNDGVYGSFNCIVFDHATPSIKPFNERDGETYNCVVYGPTCDSMDTITDKCRLPNLAIGECVYIENCGAYSSAAASQFNGFKRTPSEYIMRKL